MKKVIIVIIIAVMFVTAFVVGRYFLVTKTTDESVSQQEQTIQENEPKNELQENTNPDQLTTETPTTHLVNYSSSGFSPQIITIKVGDTATWENTGSLRMWVASDLHPTHAVYGGTSLQQHCPNLDLVAFDQCAGGQPGTSWSFTFLKKGTWDYHNHLSPSHLGTVIVQ